MEKPLYPLLHAIANYLDLSWSKFSDWIEIQDLEQFSQRESIDGHWLLTEKLWLDISMFTDSTEQNDAYQFFERKLTKSHQQNVGVLLNLRWTLNSLESLIEAIEQEDPAKIAVAVHAAKHRIKRVSLST